jgi:hypothetical protein
MSKVSQQSEVDRAAAVKAEAADGRWNPGAAVTGYCITFQAEGGLPPLIIGRGYATAGAAWAALRTDRNLAHALKRGYRAQFTPGEGVEVLCDPPSSPRLVWRVVAP